MAIRETELSLDSLVPIQARGVSVSRLEFLATLSNLPPVEAVPLEDDHYLLVEGTHRSYLAHKNGEAAIRAIVAIDDYGLLDLSSVALWGCRTLAQVQERYKSWWRSPLQAAGVESIAQLPIRRGSR